MPKGVVPKEKLIATLQRYRKEADANRNFSGGKRGNTFLPLFAKYPPEVQRVMREELSYLCIKHKDRLEANFGRYYGVLVATATRMGLDRLGLRTISRNAWLRYRTMNSIKVRLGIRDKDPDPNSANNRRKRAKAAANSPCSVSQGSLEGI